MKQEVTLQKEKTPLEASFHQKSAGISLFIIGCTAMYYLALALPMRPIALAGVAIPSGYGRLIFSTISIITVSQIVLQIVLVIGSGSASSTTMQEKAADMKAASIAYSVLVVGLLTVIGLLFVGFPAFCMANIAMITLFSSEIVRYALQLIFYRRIANR